MPTKSHRTSRGPHRTQTGRVVYDRKPHIFTLKDVLRLARAIEVDAEPAEILSGVGIIGQLLVKMIKALAEKLAPGIRWPIASVAILGLVDMVWMAAVDLLSAPRKEPLPLAEEENTL